MRKEKPEEKLDNARVVLDTNILVSAFLSPLGTPGQIVSAALRGQLQACYNRAIIDEYEKVLSRPKFRFELSPEQIKFALKILQDAGVSCNISVASAFPMKNVVFFIGLGNISNAVRSSNSDANAGAQNSETPTIISRLAEYPYHAMSGTDTLVKNGLLAAK